MGIQIKDAESLESARQADTIVLDKTGTITEGKPTVTDLVWKTETPLLKNAFYTLEKHSEHPLAEAIANHLQGNARTVEQYESLPGFGISGIIGEKRFIERGGHQNDSNVRILSDDSLE